MYQKRIDPARRLGLSKAVLTELNWKSGDRLCFYPNAQEGCLVLRKEEAYCCRCGGMYSLSIIQNEIYICQNCLREMLADTENQT